MRPQHRTPLQRAAGIAGGQHGAIAFAQLLDAGLSRDQVKRLAGKGLLIRVHRGVYRVGHRAPSTDATYMAAALATGPRSAVADFAAAHLHALTRGRTAPPPEVAATTERRVPGVRVRRVKRLETTTVRGIPVTTVARTVVDLAGRLGTGELARVCHEAQVRHRLTAGEVAAVVRSGPPPPGVAKLRAIFLGDAPVLLSRLERAFLAVVREAGLPRPVVNRRVGSGYVDASWPGLTVELDSYRYHHTRHAWERDLRRAREARDRGEAHRRYTWRDVVEDPAPMLAELHALLRESPARAGETPIGTLPRART